MANNFRRNKLPALPANISAPYLGSPGPDSTSGPGGNTVFVSKAGNDANDGFTEDAPKLTYEAAIATGRQVMLFGSGTYVWTNPAGVQYASDQNRYMFGDGLVILDYQGYSLHTGQGFYSENIIFQNVGILSFNEYGGGTVGTSLYRCELNMAVSSTPNLLMADNRKYPLKMIDCILRNVISADNLIQQFSYFNCLIFNSRLENILSLQRCYVAPDSYVLLNDQASGYAGTANNNNLRGRISLGPSLAYTDLAAQQVSNPAINAQSINADPKFNLELRRDYTLKLNSPNLAIGAGPTNMRYAQAWFVQSSLAAGGTCTPSNTWLVNSADNSIVNFLSITGFSWSQQGSLYVTENTNGVYEASYVMAPVQIAAVAQVLQNLPCLTGYNFNTDFPATEAAFDSNQPDVLNNNVPVFNAYASGSAGRNPHRLTIGMRWSTRQAPQNGTATDWVTGAAFLPFAVNTQPTWNQATGKANGEPDYNPTPANVNTIRALWIQISYTASNRYYSH